MNTIIASAIIGILLMMAGVFLSAGKSIRTLAVISAVVLFGVSVYDLLQGNAGTEFHFNNMLATNAFTAKLLAIITFCTMLYLFLFVKEISNVGFNDAEYYALIFFAVCGVGVVCTFQNMFMLFLGIEIMSIPQYILAGADKRNVKSHEASLKYFLMGAFSTGILLMGITLIYGATGTFDVTKMNMFSQAQPNVIGLLGVLFLIVALGFKASAAPFHTWTPDVYDGTPTSFTPFMASIAKVAVFVAFASLFTQGLSTLSGSWKAVIIFVICLTLLLGNVTAIYQQSVKRMLAYSSIAQAGFLLFAVYGTTVTAQKGILLYGMAYILATMSIFAVLIKLKDFTYEGFEGLAKQEPVLAFSAAIALFSMAGIPLTGGFFGKYYMLNSAMQNGMPLWVIVFAVLMAAISVVYYFKVIRAMYFVESTHSCIKPNAEIDGPFKALLVINSITIIALGILPSLATAF